MKRAQLPRNKRILKITSISAQQVAKIAIQRNRGSGGEGGEAITRVALVVCVSLHTSAERERDTIKSSVL